ncbi:lipase family protein [Xanthomonas medicagonis]|uniref:lipase family protein n=1 Tax=Xanthomonas medicagonis TaxID=3160841 RepID=UPI0035172E77
MRLNDSYVNRPRSDVDTQKIVELDGKKCEVFGYVSDPTTGLHATAYRDRQTNDIIIAYRGTDPGLFSGETSAEKADHALTTLQDIAVDAKMVRDTVNAQKSAADAFTAQMIAKAEALGIPHSQIYVAGHSLGGAVAEIEAAKYGLRGATYNGFGAAEMIDGPPQPGFQMTNYRMAGDVVSAASPHVGEVVSLASEEDIQSLRAGRYVDAPAGSAPPNALIAMRLGDHGGQQHFHSKSPDNILEPHRFQEASQRYAEHKGAIDQFGNDVFRARAELSESLRQMRGNGGRGDLSPNLQRQLNEYLALNADPAIRNSIERNGPVLGAQDHLQQGADVARAAGRTAQGLDERVAASARAAGVLGAPVFPAAAPLGGLVGDAMHLHGQGVDAAGRIVGDGFEAAKGVVERGVHAAADAVVERIHDPRVQAGAANVVNHIVDTYDGARVVAQTAAQTYQDGKHAIVDGVDRAERAVAQTYDATKHAVADGMDRAERAASAAYDATKHAVAEGVQHAERAAAKTYDATKHAVADGVERAERVATQTYDASRHAVSQAADGAARAGTQLFETSKQTVTQGVDAAKHAAGQAYDTLTHPGQWFRHDTPAQAPAPATPHRQAPASDVHRAPHANAGHVHTPASTQSSPQAARTGDQAHGIAALSASDQAMFARIRKDVPAHIDDAHVAQAMLGAKQAGIADADKIDRVQMAGDKLWVSGTTPGFRAATDVSQAGAPMQETVQQAQAFNQQREQRLAMDAQRLQETQGRGAPALG